MCAAIDNTILTMKSFPSKDVVAPKARFVVEERGGWQRAGDSIIMRSASLQALREHSRQSKSGLRELDGSVTRMRTCLTDFSQASERLHEALRQPTEAAHLIQPVKVGWRQALNLTGLRHARIRGYGAPLAQSKKRKPIEQHPTCFPSQRPTQS